MIKHVVLDIDGTLLNENHQLLDRTKDYLIELQKRGIQIHLASGRTARRMKPIYEALQIDGFCISGNGYKVFHTKKDEEYIIDTFSDEEILYFFNLLKKYDLEVFTFDDTILNYYLPDQLLEEKKQYVLTHNLPLDTPLIGGPYGVIFHHGDAYDEKNRVLELNKSAYKLCVRGPYEVLREIQKELQNHPCQSVITSSSWLEILPLNNSKGNAVKLLSQICGYKLEEIIAFGDGENDLSMLEIVGKGYAMGNAMDSVKEKANYIAPLNDDEGVYQILFEHFK